MDSLSSLSPPDVLVVKIVDVTGDCDLHFYLRVIDGQDDILINFLSVPSSAAGTRWIRCIYFRILLF